jgi:hypothetical protein
MSLRTGRPGVAAKSVDGGLCAIGRTTLAFARDNRLSITTAGLRHSMGGQAFRKGGIVLDMRGFNRIVLNESARPAQDIDDRETSQVLRYHVSVARDLSCVCSS